MTNYSIDHSVADVGAEALKLIFSSLRNSCPPNVVLKKPDAQTNREVFHLGWLTLTSRRPKSIREWMRVPTISEVRDRLKNISLDDCVTHYENNSLVFLPRMKLSIERDSSFFSEPFAGGEYGYSRLWQYEIEQMRHLLRTDFRSIRTDSLSCFERVYLNLDTVLPSESSANNFQSMSIYINTDFPNSVERWREVLGCEGVRKASDIDLDMLVS